MTIHQLNKLHTIVVEESHKHINEVQNDLEQVNFLLREAINELTKSFCSLQVAIDERQKILASPHDASETLREVNDKIKYYTGNAVTALQFEDMTRQLNERSSRRLEGLKSALSLLISEHEVEPKKMSAVFSHKSLELTNELTKSVHQTHLKSGESEIF